MKITKEDIDYARAILRKYRTAANAKKNDKARREIEHLMKTLSDLYAGGKD